MLVIRSGSQQHLTSLQRFVMDAVEFRFLPEQTWKQFPDREGHKIQTVAVKLEELNYFFET